MTNTAFNVGDSVRARASAQGMEAGALYLVSSVDTKSTLFGNFVSYCLEPLTARNPASAWVVNGHLLLDRVTIADTPEFKASAARLAETLRREDAQ